MALLFNVEAEKVVLGALINNPTLRADIRYIGPSDMSPEVNRVVMSAIDACIASGTEVSSFSIIDRLNSLGIKLAGVLEPSVYINSLSLLQVADKAAIGMAKTIKNWSVRRELYNTAQRIVKLTEKDEGKKTMELVGEATQLFNEKVGLLSGTEESEPVDLFGTIDDCLIFDDNKPSKIDCPTMGDIHGICSGIGTMEPRHTCSLLV